MSCKIKKVLTGIVCQKTRFIPQGRRSLYYTGGQTFQKGFFLKKRKKDSAKRHTQKRIFNFLFWNLTFSKILLTYLGISLSTSLETFMDISISKPLETSLDISIWKPLCISRFGHLDLKTFLVLSIWKPISTSRSGNLWNPLWKALDLDISLWKPL